MVRHTGLRVALVLTAWLLTIGLIAGLHFAAYRSG